MANRSLWPDWNEDKPYAVLVTGLLFILFLAGVVWVGYTLKQMEHVGRAPVPERTIAVSGEGKVLAQPDIATIDLGVVSQKATQVEAVTDATTKMNSLVARMQQLGIDEKDLQTQQYTVYPRYDYPNGRQVQDGFEAQQQLVVRIRESSKLTQVLKIATEVGANQIGDLRYTIDDPEPMRAEARAKAIRNAKMKAAELSKAVGVRLGRVVAFDENSNGGTPAYPYFAKDAMGMGGAAQSVPAPEIQVGSQEVISNVVLTFEIR